jgi:hypothetical protein
VRSWKQKVQVTNEFLIFCICMKDQFYMSSDSLRLRFRQLQCHGHHSKVSEPYKGLLRYHII